MLKPLSFTMIFLFVLFMSMPADSEEGEGRAYYDFGVFSYEDGDYEDAENNLKMALSFEPDNPYYLQFLGKTYLKMERFEDSEKQLNKAWELDPDISELKHDLAFLNFKTSKYKKAADLFMEITMEDPDDILARYHAGLCLYRLERFEKASGFFIRAAESSPSLKLNGYYYAGICFLKTGELEAAADKFSYIKEHADSAELRESAMQWLRAVEHQKKALRPFSLYLRAVYEYDDNVQLEPVDDDIYSDESDCVTVMYLSGTYNFVNKNQLKIGAGYSQYMKFYNHLEEYDLVGSVVNLFLRKNFSKFSFGFNYIPSYYWVNSERYMSRHQFNPLVMWQVHKNLFSRFSYSFYYNDHFQDEGRDGHTNDVYLDVFYSLFDRKVQLSGGIGYEDNSASHPDEYYGRLKTRLGISFNVPEDLKLTLAGKYNEKEYDNIDSYYGIKREDNKYVASISLSRKLFYDWLSASLDFSYTENDSNIGNYTYERKTTSLYLSASY